MSKSRFGFPTSGATTAQFSDMRGRSDDPNNLYYNAIIVNNSTETTSNAGDPAITFQDTRALPILQDSSKYAISVENFTINGAGKTLPVLIPQIRHYKGNATDAGPMEIYLNRNPNNTIYDLTFTWQYGGTQSQPLKVFQSTRSVQWIPANRAKWQIQPNAFPNYKYSQPETEYYYCYSYTHWVNLMNNALACAWGDVQVAVEASGLKFGTKCPFFSYDEKTNLFSLFQDSYTACVPYGDSIGKPSLTAGPNDPPNPLRLYGPAKPDAEYSPGEYAFIGYNTNLESLISNFDTTYLSTGFPYPSLGVDGILVSPLYPDGNEPCASSIVQNNLSGSVSTFTGNSMQIEWLEQPTSTGTNWSFRAAPLRSDTPVVPIVGQSFLFDTNFDATAVSYIVPGVSLTAIGELGITLVGEVVTFSTDQLTLLVKSIVGSGEDSDWLFVPTPMTSSSLVTPVVDQAATFSTNLYPTESVFKVGSSVSSNGLVGDVTSLSETLTYTLVSGEGGSGTLNYTDSTTPFGFSPRSFYSGQYGSFQTGDIVKGEDSEALAQIVDVIGSNVSSGNVLVVRDQTAPYSIGDTVEDTSQDPNSVATVVGIQGPNVAPVYTVTVSEQKNPIVVGDTFTSGLASATITNVVGDNTGYGTLTVNNQSAPFKIGEVIQALPAEATIVDIVGPNNAEGTFSTGLLTVANTYTNQTNQLVYSTPVTVGSTIVKATSLGTNAVITGISGDNGYSSLTFSSQKNKFVIGDEIESYQTIANLASGDPYLSKAKIVDIIGPNTGYGTVNITNQNGKFGIDEVIVNTNGNAIATIVSINGDNNGYGTLSYINQLTTGAPGAFVPGEFLLYDNVAFAQVVLDTQNVINATEGNIGSVLVITGVELGGVFTPTSNAPVPGIGAVITGSLSSTTADMGAIAYLETATLLVKNVAGAFYVGDMIVDNVGYGLSATSTNTSTTAICNGFSYLDNGTLILKEVLPAEGDTVNLGSFGSSNLISDSSVNAVSATALTVANVTANQQFLAGDPVVGSVSQATGVVVTNCGPVPYTETYSRTQLLSVLKDPGSVDFIPGEKLQDGRRGATLYITDRIGAFNIGDTVQDNGSSRTISSIFPTIGITLATIPLPSIPIATLITQTGATGKIAGGNYDVEVTSGTFVIGAVGWTATSNIIGINTIGTTATITLDIPSAIPVGTVISQDGKTATISVVTDTTHYTISGMSATFTLGAITWTASNNIAGLQTQVGLTLSPAITIDPGTIITQGSVTGVILDGSGTVYNAQVNNGALTAGSFTFPSSGLVSVIDSSTPGQMTITFDTETNTLAPGNAIASSEKINTPDDVTAPNLVLNLVTPNDITVPVTDVKSVKTNTILSTALFSQRITVSDTTQIVGDMFYKSTTSGVVFSAADSGGGVYTMKPIFGSGFSNGSGNWNTTAFTKASGDYDTSWEATLPYESVIANNTVVTGSTSAATGTTTRISNTSYTITVTDGIFEDGENLTWGTSGSDTITNVVNSITINLSTPQNIPLSTVITDGLTYATGTILTKVDSDTYIVTVTSGTFGNHTIYWGDFGTGTLTTKINDSKYVLDVTAGDFDRDGIFEASIGFNKLASTGLSQTMTLTSPLPVGSVLTDQATGAVGTIIAYTSPTYTVQLSNAFLFEDGDFVTTPGSTGVVLSKTSPSVYVVNNLVGTFSAPDIFSWTATGNIASTLIVSRSIEITISSPTTLLIPGTQISNGTTGANIANGVIVYSTSSTRYTVNVFEGIFRSGDTIKWKGASGNIVYVPPDGSLQLTNVTGVFASSGTLTNTRPLVQLESTLIEGGNPSYPSGTSLYNWDKESTAVVSTSFNNVFSSFIYCPEDSMPILFEHSDSIGVLPFRGYPGGTIRPSGASLTMDDAFFNVGDNFYAWNGGTDNDGWSAYGKVISKVGKSITVAFKGFKSVGGGNAGISAPITCCKTIAFNSNSKSILRNIDYYTGDVNYTRNALRGTNFGFMVSSAVKRLATATITASSIGSETNGDIVDISVSGSSAYVNTFKPPTANTSLTVTDVSGTFNAQDALAILVTSDPLVLRPVGIASDYTQTNQPVPTSTVLTIKNVDDSFDPNDTITGVTSNATATVLTCSFLNSSVVELSGLSGGTLDPFNRYTTSTSSGVINTVVSTNPSTTLLVDTPSGTFAPGDDLVNGQVLSYTSQNGSLLLKPIQGQLEINELIQDQRTLATAIIGVTQSQSIRGQTSGAIADIVRDTGSALLLTDVNGDFDIGEIVIGDLTQTSATVSSFSVFSIGETVTVYSDGDSFITGIIITNPDADIVLASPVDIPLLTVITQEDKLAVVSAKLDSTHYTITAMTAAFTTGPIAWKVDSGATGVIVSDNGSEMVVNMITAPNFESGNSISDGTSTAVLTRVSNPTMTVLPSVVGESSDSWTFVSTPLTSSSSVGPGAVGSFTTNLTAGQSLVQQGDQIVVSEVSTDFNTTQLYYPENVVEVNQPFNKINRHLIESPFPPSSTRELSYIESVQDFESTSSLWSPICSIVIGTSLINVRNEYNGSPLALGDANVGSGNKSSSGFQHVLLEVPLELLPQTGWRGLLFYEPKTETLTSLELSKSVLKDLDFQIYWRNRLTNTLTPLSLYNGGSANIRLLFKRVSE